MLEFKQYEVEIVNPIVFFTSDRIDIIIKYLYAISILSGKGQDFYKKLYLDHINAFNGFVEADDTNKVGSESFDNNFRALLKSIQEHGFDDKHIIPVQANGIPLDGAHRIAIAMALGLQVKTFKICDTKPVCFNLAFFNNRGMENFEIDFIAEQYAHIKPNVFLVMVWPIAKGHQKEIENVLSKSGTIIYQKDIRLTMNGMVNLQRQVYQKEQWLGSYSNDFEGVWLKASQCYSEDGKMRVFLYESTANLIQVKEEIRSLFNIGKHSVHINDTHEETIELANILFNNNSILFLNCATRKNLNKYRKLLSEYKKAIPIPNVDDFAIIGGVMSEFGIRDANDLDYITTNSSFPDHITSKIEKETKKLKYTNVKISELIYNPRHYFKVNGLKFVCPQIILEIKKTRNNDSDKEDILYLKKIVNDSTTKLSITEIIKQYLSLSFYRREVKILLLKVRFLIYSLINGKYRKSYT